MPAAEVLLPDRPSEGTDLDAQKAIVRRDLNLDNLDNLDLDIDIDIEHEHGSSADSPRFWDQALLTGDEADRDSDMNDSDGGAPLGDVVLTDADADADAADADWEEYEEQEEYEEEDQQEEDQEEEEWQDGDDEAGQEATHPLLGPGALHFSFPPPPLQQTQTTDAPMEPLSPISLSNQVPSILGSENPGLADFLRDWAFRQMLPSNANANTNTNANTINLEEVLRQARDGVDEVGYDDLRGDACDLQGLDWERMGTTREAARERRNLTYRNYVNKLGSDRRAAEAVLPARDSFFRFRRMLIRRDVAFAHFQLRSVLACPSRVQAFYASRGAVHVLDTASRRTDVALDLSRGGLAAAGAISTLDAGCGALLAGTFTGVYCLQALDTEDRRAFAQGHISPDYSGITNHIRIYRPRRSHGPVAAIASNDHGLRVLDLTTEKMLSETTYPFALNCSALSPDGRLRALVGDSLDVFITSADSGETLQRLGGHRDYGFACDWSPDGRTVATGFQDKAVRIWDARRWTDARGVPTPLRTLRAEMAGVRALRFSPLGSGPPVLVAAEEADYLNLVDATTFASKQTLDVFGEIGGVAFANDGRDLNVLCCDTQRGGLLCLERCGSTTGNTSTNGNTNGNTNGGGGSGGSSSFFFTERQRVAHERFIVDSCGSGAGYNYMCADDDDDDRHVYGAAGRPEFWGDMEPF